ncbi:VolA/Pla-1 family phospholipase [Planctobacterium marinum]|uniref:Lipase n=1 Tax=Planctobacterium marinum TaxID=1631968 RepID=A0AA48HQ87_9ALTE|nr:lipase [Planctobacterium marinum]
MKKLLLCTAIAASLSLSGCGGGGEDLVEVQAQTPVDKPFARIVFNPPSTFPLPNDAAMLPATSLFDFTIESENQTDFDGSNPLDAVGALDGWSTQYPMTIDVDLPANVTLPLASLQAPNAIHIYEATQALEGTSAACQAIASQVAAPGVPCEIGERLTLNQDYAVTLSDSDTIAIIPLRPLKPGQGYMLVVTEDLLDSDGRPVLGSTTWELARQDINSLPLSSADQLQLQGLVNLLVNGSSGAGIPIEQTSYAAYISTGSAGTVTATVKQLQVGPFAQALGTLLAQGVDLPTAQATAAQYLPVVAVGDSPRGDSAYDVLGPTLLGADTFAQFEALGLNCDTMRAILTGDPLNPLYPTVASAYGSLAPFCAATLKTGQVNLPYYSNPENPLGDWWRSACTSGAAVSAIEGSAPGTVASLIANGAVGPNNELCQAASGGQLYDLNLAAIGITDRRHLTKFAPVPVAQGSNPDGTETIEVQVTIPDEELINFLATINPDEIAPVSKPEAGWPVVVIQHGITSKKEDVLAAAGTLALAGFATVAIDHPLHGSRGFEIDGQTVNASNGFGGSSTDYLNLGSLLSARDNLRQSIVDTMGLRLGLNAWVDTTGEADIDPTNVHFMGQSLGSITGIGTVATANTPMSGDLAAFNSMFEFKTAGLSVPGGGIAQFLIESAGFGPLVSASVLAGGSESFQVALGTYAQTNGVPVSQALIPAYLQYVGERTAAQAAADAAIIGQFAFAAQTVIEGGDPNNYAARLAATTPVLLHEVVGDGSEGSSDQVIPNTTSLPTSGTEALIRFLGLPSISSSVVAETPQSGAVRFVAGEHGSLFNPTSSVAATTEMQLQMATFFATQGTAIVVRDESVVAN